MLSPIKKHCPWLTTALAYVKCTMSQMSSPMTSPSTRPNCLTLPIRIARPPVQEWWARCQLIQEADAKTFEEWEHWYLERHPNAIENAKSKVKAHIEKLRAAIDKIDEAMIEQWLEDLILVKTAEGLLIQRAILKHLSGRFDLPYKMASSEDESKGIDGYVGETPVSIKPESYKQKTSVRHEDIDAPLIFYKKTQKYVHVKYEESLFA